MYIDIYIYYHYDSYSERDSNMLHISNIYVWVYVYIYMYICDYLFNYFFVYVMMYTFIGIEL